jgi:hypothetical protein
MNALALTQMHAIGVAKEDRERFLTKALEATVQFVQEVVDEKNAKLCKAFLEAFANATKTHLERQDSVLETIPGIVAQAINDLGLREACVRDLEEERDKDGQPHPGAGDEDPLANIGGGLVIDPETGEAKFISPEEARKLYKECRHEDDDE